MSFFLKMEWGHLFSYWSVALVVRIKQELVDLYELTVIGNIHNNKEGSLI